MSYALHEVIDGSLDIPLHDPNNFTILWTNEESRAGVYVPLESGRYILAESSCYEPSQVPEWLWRSDEAPFMTNGEQVLLNLTSGQYTQRGIHYDEGEIQGLVYALDAMVHGGRLAPQEYQEFIERSVKGFDNSYRWMALGGPAIERYVQLGFIEAEILKGRDAN